MLFDHIEEKEAVKRAALIEINGYRFYSLLAEKAENKEARAAFRLLAEDEKKHLKALETRFFHEAGFSDEITEEELIIEEYLEKKGVADIFTRRINVDKLVHAIDSPKKALTVALDTERHSVEYFEHLARRTRTDEGRKIYLELADEERSHVRQIESMLATR